MLEFPNPAEKKVEVPSLFLIVVGSLGVLLNVMDLVKTFAPQQEVPGVILRMIPPDMLPAFENAMRAGDTLGPVQAILFGAISAFVVYGGLQMRSRTQYGVAVGASITALLPCSCACCLGLPVGIWCLVTLFNEDVKATFE
jgi:hypothetical protein